MYFKVTEVFDYKQDRYTYDIYREERLLHKAVFHAELEKFVMDRACLHDVDLIQYIWGSHVMTGSEAREMIQKMFQTSVVTSVIIS